MAGTGMYKELLGAMAGGTPGAPAPPGAPKNVGSALGAPEPTGVGAFPSGGDALSPRAAASATIDQLAGLKSHYPSASDRIDGMIAEITTMSKEQAAKAGGLAPVVPPRAAAPAVPPPPIAGPPPPLPPLGIGGGPPPMLGGGPPLPPM